MLYKVRDELKTTIASEIHLVRSDMEAIKSDIHSIKSGQESMKSEINSIKTSVHRIELLVEEQNNRNKIVLDGLSFLMDRN